MARPRKQTVDYFPHDVAHGRTLYILEQAYANDGYAFWFKLLETLGETAGHYIDCKVPGAWDYFRSKTGLRDGKARMLMETLVHLHAIDEELWVEREVIWCQSFVDRIADAYRKRDSEAPEKPTLDSLSVVSGEKNLFNDVDSTGNVQNHGFPRIKESKVNETKRKEYTGAFEKWWKEYPRGRKGPKGEAYKRWLAIGPDEIMASTMTETLIKQKEHKKQCDETQVFHPEFPHARRYLREERWADEIEMPESGTEETTEQRAAAAMKKVGK